ncbi:hypothetical protein RND71_042903 [Anisodus tanguticus]|uniref:Glutamate--cysteine ligase n=1 Tax=Anisodus tanguticus TaxID=243964 RepID=A0AAE1QSB5_9SOLA|nr:hypothetical protein RND71_042903 [Anisodus tanguticus]
MALMSQAGSSQCIYSEKIRCIGGHNMEMFKMKEICSGVHISSRNSSKRGRLEIVAASPPTEDAVVAAEPLTKEDLVGYLASGCKSKEKWRIGTEHEKFGFESGTLRPMKYEQIADLLNGIAERFDWEKVMEGDKIIGLKQGKQSISLEPGGQFELSGAPLETLHQTCAEVNSHLYQVKAVAEEMGIGFLGTGFQPKWGLKDIPVMPKVNLDFCSEADMIRKFRAGLALQPIATALFANSPFTEGKPNGYLSMRRHEVMGSSRGNSLLQKCKEVMSSSRRNSLLQKCKGREMDKVYWSSKRAVLTCFGVRSTELCDGLNQMKMFEQYVDYALDVPMYFAYRKKKYVDCAGLSFRVRLKRYLEMRGADGGPWRRLCALPAFWVGILYDEESLQSVLDMTSDWTAEEREMLRNKVPKSGLKTPFRDGLLKHVAQDVVKLAKEGLERRGFKETGFLNEVTEVVRTGVTPAEKLLELYHGKWGQSVDPVFEELLY